MPDPDVFRSGFSGASLPAVTQWCAERVEDAKTILVPFAGSGRDIAAMAGKDRTIVSFDTQFYSRAIVEGIFAAETAETNVDKIHYTKGYFYENPMKNMDERCAGFIDWVGAHGTLYDKACMGSAVVRSTLMGRMTQWYANVEQLYLRFLRNRDSNVKYLNLPGKFVHHEGSFFDIQPPFGPFDLMQVDPPKVIVGSDIYSANYNGMNRALGGENDLPKWGWREVLPRFRNLMEVDVQRTLFFYVSGVRPDYPEVFKLLEQYGEIKEEDTFTHQGRTDYAVHLRRKDV